MTGIDPIEQVRSICLALPEATERETWGEPTFRVRDKIFTMIHQSDGRPAIWLKAPPGAQDFLTAADPTTFFAPPYVGGIGWLGIRLDGDPDWDDVVDHIHDSYRLVAPKRLAARLKDGLGENR